jgi:Flp pilus assembly protein TadG
MRLPVTERRKLGRRGNVALITALSLTMMMMFAALSFDVGNIHRVRAELQSAMDSAALAGASRLDGSATGITAAKARAVQQANDHKAYTGQLSISTSDVTVGTWDFTTSTFSAWNGNTNNATLAAQFAVKVAYKVPSVAHPFAAVMGNSSAPVGAFAVAVGGGPQATGCGFPLVVPDCSLKNPDQSGNCQYCMIYADNNSDDAAWTSFTNQNGVSHIFDAIVEACTSSPTSCRTTGGSACVPNVDSTTHKCISQVACTNASDSTTDITLNNGNNVANNGTNTLCGLIKLILLRNGATNPQMFTVQVPVIETGIADGGTCTKSQLSGTPNVVGYTDLDIFGLRCNGDAAQTADPAGPVTTCTSPSSTYILATQHCDSTPDVHQLSGGGSFGIKARRRLVQ